MRLRGRCLKSGGHLNRSLGAALCRAAIGLSVVILAAAGCVRAGGGDPLEKGGRFSELAPVNSPAGEPAQGSASEPHPIPDVAAAPPGDAPGTPELSEASPPAPATGDLTDTDSDARPVDAAPQAVAAPDAADANSTDAQGAPIALNSSLDGEEPPPELATEILGAYASFWDSYWDAASHPVNPEHPGIARYSTEPLRSRAVGVLLGRATEGIALRLPPDHGAGRIVHIEGWDHDGAELLDCLVDTAVLYEVATGRVRNDERATVVHLALMRRVGGFWRVAEIFEQAIHTGRTDGCIMQANTQETLGPTGGDAGRAARGQESAW